MGFAFTMPKAAVAKGGKAQAKKKFVIDCTVAETDSILDCSNFEKYLKERIKVAGKAGNLGETVKVNTEKSKIIVQAEGAFSKRYLKYLAKKFLKKMQMRDFLRVVSTNKTTYELKYFNIQENEDDADVE